MFTNLTYLNFYLLIFNYLLKIVVHIKLYKQEPNSTQIMETVIFYSLIVILIVSFLFEKFLDYLNNSYKNKPLPPEVQGIFNDAEYKLKNKYDNENEQISNISSTLSIIIILIVLVNQFFGTVHNWAAEISTNPIVQALIFMGIIAIINGLISMPFSVYSTFSVEERYGFNKTSVKTYIFDTIKSALLTGILGGGILAFIVWQFSIFGSNFWLIAWLAVAVLSLIMSIFYSYLLAPIYNKQIPLPTGELRDAIEKFAAKVNFKIDNIYLIDGSKRSTKANAYFTGLGAKKRIVLYDTLIEKLDIQEVVAVLAHEIGHYKKRHTIKGLISSILQAGFALFLFSVFSESVELSRVLGAETNVPVFHLSIIAFGILFSPASVIFNLVFTFFSRKNEYEADDFAADNNLANELISALKKLAAANYSNLNPHPWYVFFNYSHPPLIQRIRAIKNKFDDANPVI